MDSAVSDADVLIHLAKLNQLTILPLQFERIFISEIVKREIIDQGIQHGKPDAVSVQSFLDTGNLQIMEIHNIVVEEIQKKYNIHSGESSIIALGKKIGTRYLLANERAVRDAAKKENFLVVGTLGILARGFLAGSLTQGEILNLLEEVEIHPEIFRFHPKVIKSFREKII